jgi:ubiquitin-protein ligase
MSEPKLNKNLYTDITRLKLLSKENAEVRFKLIESPFMGDEDGGDLANKKREEYVIIGQIFPNSEIYRERSYKIEIKLTKSFPGDPPEVRFLTPIYHPNVDPDGKSKCDI